MTFDGEPPLTLEPREDPPPPRRPGRGLLLGGIAGACVLGLGLGLMARPQLLTGKPRSAPMQPAAQRQMEIVEAEPPPQQALPPRPPLETMSPGLVAAAPEPPEPPEPLRAPKPDALPLPPDAPLAPEAPWAPQPPDATWREPVRAERPSFDCRRARSPAEDMVCSDPVLAAADRQMARAFQRAVRAGVPVGRLRAEQDDWRDIREDAAMRSARAVAAIYDQRIEELNEMADGQGPGW